jgi:AcrR family transcriptional regulator
LASGNIDAEIGVGLRRRDEYAQATRQGIVDAARRLFCERGYFATKVDDIAALARVSPATVYAVSGGKQGLLRTLMDLSSARPVIAAALEEIEKLDDPAAIIRVVAATCRSMREEFGDILRFLIATAPHDRVVAEGLAGVMTRCRQAFVPVSQRLSDLGGLREELDVADAVDVLWFYFGFSALFTLHDENGWSYERAGRWLCEQANSALLRQAPAQEPVLLP